MNFSVVKFISTNLCFRNIALFAFSKFVVFVNTLQIRSARIVVSVHSGGSQRDLAFRELCLFISVRLCLHLRHTSGNLPDMSSPPIVPSTSSSVIWSYFLYCGVWKIKNNPLGQPGHCQNGWSYLKRTDSCYRVGWLFRSVNIENVQWLRSSTSSGPPLRTLSRCACRMVVILRPYIALRRTPLSQVRSDVSRQQMLNRNVQISPNLVPTTRAAPTSRGSV